MSNNIEIEKDIQLILSEYLGFDLNEIFDCGDLVYIFGGCLRDIISYRNTPYKNIPDTNKIHDIDILTNGDTFKAICELLKQKGYKNVGLNKKDILKLYNNRLIFEPHTYINKDYKIVQLIRPCGYNFNNNSMTYNKELLFEIAENVDISCCGLIYSKKSGLIQTFPNSIKYCLYKKFTINKKAKMYNIDRIHERRFKLEERGWKLVNNEFNIINYHRHKMIKEIQNK